MHLAPRTCLLSPRVFAHVLIASALLLCASTACLAQEPAYFVTYSQELEEPGNLEIAFRGAAGTPRHGNEFRSGTVEFEYGAKAWWTTELYLSGQNTAHDSTIFTGYRIENRFRPFFREHFINPVLYVEYENISEADRSLLEIVGHDTQDDLRVGNREAKPETEHAIESKLILSKYVRGFNVSGNFIAEKEIGDEPWEFGYALGVSRPLSLKASAHDCVFCRERFAAGLELYGGLGDSASFGLNSTSQYLGPTVAFDVPHGPTISFSPNFGLNANSVGAIYRVKVSYELQQIFHRQHRRGQ